MSLIQINRNPSRKELNWFGALFAVFFGLIGAMAWWRFGSRTAALALWSLGAIIPAVYYAVPSIRRQMFVGWMYLAYPIGLAVSTAMLAIVYYLVFAPIGLALRAFGHDPLRRRADPSAKSYWIEHRTGGDLSQYFKQY